jgi:DNA-damage-inducible protein J
MSKTAQLNIRADIDVKNKVETIFKELGLSHSQAIELFYRQVIFNQGLPFEIKLPQENIFNDETKQAIEDTNNNIDVKIHKTAKSLFKELGI